MASLTTMFAAGKRRLAGGMARIRRTAAGWPWPLIVIVGGFGLAMPWQPVLVMLFPWLAWRPAGPYGAYEQALRESAIKRQDDQKILRRIEDTTVQMVNFRTTPLPGGQLKLPGPLWVALADEVKAACADSDDAVLRLQHVLGLPPRGGNPQVYPIAARSADMLRPCVSGDALTASACSFDLPPDPTAAPPPADGSAKAAAYDKLSDAYKQLRFVTDAMWQRYRTGFPDRRAADGDYPYTGYPFTGMGWTYNWDPAVGSHVGVSEFVLLSGSTVTVGAPIDPTSFCNGSAASAGLAPVPAAAPAPAADAPAAAAPPTQAAPLPPPEAPRPATPAPAGVPSSAPSPVPPKTGQVTIPVH